MKFVVIGAVFLGALGVLIWLGIDTIPVLTIQELKAKEYSGVCRIDDGVIHSIQRTGNPLEFTIQADANPGLLLPVRSDRNMPDNFKIGIKVSVKGIHDPKAGKFVADEIMTKCPSRYEASKAPDVEGSPKPPPEQKVP